MSGVVLEIAKRYRDSLGQIRDALQEISRGQACFPLYLFAPSGWVDGEYRIVVDNLKLDESMVLIWDFRERGRFDLDLVV